eukprot:4869641-Alexandrium_andersonii.AAC.1
MHGRVPKWKQEAATMRAEMGAPPEANPWTHKKSLRGVPDQPRIRELVDLAYMDMHVMKTPQSRK